MFDRNLYRGLVLLFLVVVSVPHTLLADPVDKVDAATRCSVCGMFVAKYDNWLSQARLADGSVLFFDGVKDMMVFSLNPGKYSGAGNNDIVELWVKDYYSLDWVAGREAFFVIGSDVYGPMGKEFVPFRQKAAAENFLSDHKGERIVVFDDITDSLVQSMRSGMKMRHGKK